MKVIDLNLLNALSGLNFGIVPEHTTGNWVEWFGIDNIAELPTQGYVPACAYIYTQEIFNNASYETEKYLFENATYGSRTSKILIFKALDHDRNI